MDKAGEPAQNALKSGWSALALVAALQLLMWCFTATILDGGFVLGVYSCMLLGYWAVVAAVWMLGLVRGQSFRRLVAASGWLPPAACGIWLLWLSGLLRG
jgi:hypothetical protein